jgi:hypothetical protein
MKDGIEIYRCPNFGGTACDTDHYLVVENCRLLVGKQAVQILIRRNLISGSNVAWNSKNY